MATPDSSSQRISVVVPTWNEEERIVSTLTSVVDAPDVEVVVADGGSTDRTASLAKECGAKVITVSASRSRQMNAGAYAATGDILLFLHADTRMPDGFHEHVREVLARPGASAGAFRLGIDASRPRGLRLIEWGVNARSVWRQLPYGDQALFMRQDTFREVGGFQELPILEDYELVLRLRRYGRIEIAEAAVLTSARRWERLGIWRTTLINQAVVWAYRLGVSPGRLANWYSAACP